MTARGRSAVLEGDRRRGSVEIFLDRTPFYAEGGGQVGDTGTIVDRDRASPTSTTPCSPLPGLVAHRARVDGELHAGQDALATIDGERREAIRRNHTATHLLHAALRDGARRPRAPAGLARRARPPALRLLAPRPADADEELDEVFDAGQRATCSTDDAGRDDRDLARGGRAAWARSPSSATSTATSVRVVRAGPHSLEFCGGTHVDSLGAIGPIQLVVGGLDRLEHAAHRGGDRARRAASAPLERERLLDEASALLRTDPENLPDAVAQALRAPPRRRARARHG